MKINRILSTAGVCPQNSTKLRSYCNLMQGGLIDKWLFADDFVDSHVCFIRDDYLANMNQDSLNKSQVIVVINVSNKTTLTHKYQISAPLSAAKIKDVLNKISTQVEFKQLHLTASNKSKIVTKKFTSVFTKIRSNFFGKKDLNVAALKQRSKQQFIERISKKININELPAYSIVLLGSPSSGKTTAIQSVSSGKALKSDVAATDSVASSKQNTTVGIDYAEITINKYRKIKLFGTPGQIKFNFIWDIVGKNADAFIILLDMSRPEPLSFLKFYLKFLNDELGKTSLIYCALTHCDKYKGDIARLYRCIKTEFPKLDGFYKLDARNKMQVASVINDIYPQIRTKKKVNTNNLANSQIPERVRYS